MEQHTAVGETKGIELEHRTVPVPSIATIISAPPTPTPAPPTTIPCKERSYYIATSTNDRHGPFSLEDMVERIVLGQLNEMTPIWFHGLNEWQPLGLLLEFRDLLLQMMPPPQVKQKEEDIERVASHVVQAVLASAVSQLNMEKPQAIVGLRKSMDGWTQTSSPTRAETETVNQRASLAEQKDDTFVVEKCSNDGLGNTSRNVVDPSVPVQTGRSFVSVLVSTCYRFYSFRLLAVTQ